jgi:hypothetical protein
MFVRTRLAALVVAALTSAVLLAQGHDVVIPYVPPPQDNTRLHDPVTALVHRVEAGTAHLTAAPVGGVLPSLLRELKIPASSQVLVFSKTSLQYEFISPRTPRALYFNDDTYLGFVPDSTTMELSSVDPEAGAVFYTIAHRTGARPVLVTDARCLQCHQIPATLGVSGHLMRSTFARADGTLARDEPSFLTDDTSPFEERWGGWFVTGTVQGALHMGNAPLPESQHAASFDRHRGSAMTDVSAIFEHQRYLSPESDVVALMVLGHQIRMHNLIARLHHTASAPGAAQKDVDAGIEDLLRYMLFVDAVPLPGPVKGSTTFAADFERLGPTDAKGRSLRDFDLTTRLFKYPCSYLIYSDAFLGLPAAAKTAIYARLDAILSGQDRDPAFAKLRPADRTAIREILQATHPEFSKQETERRSARRFSSAIGANEERARLKPG